MIIITLGNGVELAVTYDNRLRLQLQIATHSVMLDLGPATLKNMNDLQSNIERLKIHAVDA